MQEVQRRLRFEKCHGHCVANATHHDVVITVYGVSNKSEHCAFGTVIYCRIDDGVH
jgi:hypothetical protein